MSDTAQVVVVGGGAFGTSIAYHLGALGIKDVLLVERFDLADGTTWHSGGFVGQLREHPAIMQLIAKSTQLYPQLATSAEAPLEWFGVGSLRLATRPERVAEFEVLVERAVSAGVAARVVSAAEVAELAPALNTDDLLGAVWIPADGYLEPDTLPQSLAAAARAHGVTIRRESAALGIETDAEGVSSVRTTGGLIASRHVVLAAGFATPQLAETLGLFVPIGVSRQQYLVTADLPADLSGMPTVREPDHSQYFRTIGRQVLLGAITDQATMLLPEEVPTRPRLLFDPVEQGLDEAWRWCQHRVPALRAATIDRTVRGPEGITSDGELIADETEVPGLWIAAAGNGHGIAAAGGLGWYVAGRIGHGLDPSIPMPSIDPAPFRLDRFPVSYQSDPAAMLAAMRDCELAHYSEVQLSGSGT